MQCIPQYLKFTLPTPQSGRQKLDPCISQVIVREVQFPQSGLGTLEY